MDDLEYVGCGLKVVEVGKRDVCIGGSITKSGRTCLRHVLGDSLTSIYTLPCWAY
jgi:hypothetical protein